MHLTDPANGDPVARTIAAYNKSKVNRIASNKLNSTRNKSDVTSGKFKGTSGKSMGNDNK